MKNLIKNFLILLACILSIYKADASEVFLFFPTDTLPTNGDVVNILRLDGVGAGSNFLDITDESREQILSGSFDGTIEYKGSRAPFKVRVIDPSKIQAKTFELTLHDDDDMDGKLEDPVFWKIGNVDNPNEVYYSNTDISIFQEQEIPEIGISISIVQGLEPGNNEDGEGLSNNGIIGYEEVYENPAGPKWLFGQKDENGPPFNFIANYVVDGDFNIDPTRAFSTIGPGYFFPYYMLDYRLPPFNTIRITPVEDNLGGLIRQQMKIEDLNNIDFVFTKDKSKWTRCPIVESTSRDMINYLGFSTVGDREKFELRDAPSVGKEDLDGDGLPDPDGDGKGMGWFPGYVIDVETGQRLNLIFGEASMYRCDEPLIQQILYPDCENIFQDPPLTGADMMWNPTNMAILPNEEPLGRAPWRYILGGQHYVYVINTPYDEGEAARNFLDPEKMNNPLLKTRLLREITWTGFLYLSPGSKLLSYAEGLIPNDCMVKLRVDNPFAYYTGTGVEQGRPTYRFTLDNFYSKTKEGSFSNGEVFISPNPIVSNDRSLFVQNLPDGLFELEIRDLNGKVIQKNKQKVYGKGEIQLLNNLMPGAYLLVIKKENRVLGTLQFIVVD
ncbi:MAG: T9SS type A sorting domain-containing protein [Saprospiraceae bacterium]|nr:T9SS type A sorting domain-containing protein [Saprospiraceae bacterium]